MKTQIRFVLVLVLGLVTLTGCGMMWEEYSATPVGAGDSNGIRLPNTIATGSSVSTSTRFVSRAMVGRPLVQSTQSSSRFMVKPLSANPN